MENNTAVTISSLEGMTRKQILKKFMKKSQLREVVGRFMKNKLAIVGLVIISIIILSALFADVLADYQTVALKTNPSNRLQGPSGEHWLGTDEMGRDVFARLVHGARASLSVSFVTVLISLLAGAVIGSIAGYYGGKIDNAFMRVMDVFLCLPNMLLAIAVVASFGTSMLNVIMALSIAQMPKFARIIRGAVLSVRDMEYVEAAKAIGATDGRIMVSHVLINCMGPIIVQATLNVAQAILSISALSFIGLGVQPPTPEWGNMLSSGREYMRNSSYLVIVPGMAIFFTVLSLNLLGDGLRDALDPRLKQ